MANREDISVKEYLDIMLKRLEHHMEEQLTAEKESTKIELDSLKEATTLARTTMDERLARMNEFRDSLRDQSNTFLTKAEFEARQSKVDEDIRSLREFRSELSGKASQSQLNLTLIISLLGIFISAVSFLIRIL